MGADDPDRQAARRHALRAHRAEADLAALLVTRPANVRYLTGFSGSPETALRRGDLIKLDFGARVAGGPRRRLQPSVGPRHRSGDPRAPGVRAGADGRISPGTPVTVEPGVYLPGFGGVRIEDLAVVRPGGHDVLTTATKELLEL